MNVYRCWYQGTPGFAGKLDRKHWLFVPELGQMDTRIHRNLRLSELVFRNQLEYVHEERLLSDNRFSIPNLIRVLVSSPEQSCTTAGMLLLPPGK